MEQSLLLTLLSFVFVALAAIDTRDQEMDHPEMRTSMVVVVVMMIIYDDDGGGGNDDNL